MQYDIALLTFGNQIRKTFPVFQIFGTYDTRFGYGRRQITRSSIGIKAFAAENSINLAVFMGCQAHIIYIRFFGI